MSLTVVVSRRVLGCCSRSLMRRGKEWSCEHHFPEPKLCLIHSFQLHRIHGQLLFHLCQVLRQGWKYSMGRISFHREFWKANERWIKWRAFFRFWSHKLQVLLSWPFLQQIYSCKFAKVGIHSWGGKDSFVGKLNQLALIPCNETVSFRQPGISSNDNKIFTGDGNDGSLIIDIWVELLFSSGVFDIWIERTILGCFSSRYLWGCDPKCEGKPLGAYSPIFIFKIILNAINLYCVCIL